jgi:two-component system, LytTR family, sensor histidine kinase AgrC
MGKIAYLLLGGITDLVSLVLIMWGIMNISFVTKKLVIAMTGIAITILLIGMGTYQGQYSDLMVIFETCIVVIAVCFLFQGNVFKLLAYSLLAYVLMLFLNASLEGLCSMFKIDINNAFMRIIFNLIIAVLLGIVALMNKRRGRQRQQFHISKKIYALLFGGAGTGIMIMAGLLVEANSKAGENARRIIFVISIIIVICYCAACIMMVFITESRDSYKALSQTNQRVIEAQQQYYSLINDKQQEIRSIRHEMKNHLSCIHGLYQADKLKEMEQYIHQLIESSVGTADLLDTGNDIVNAILNEAQSRYRKEHISIRLEGGFPPKLYVAPMDLCVVIANIVSNAVEAIERMENREEDYYVDVKISSYKNDLFIDVKNPIDHHINIVNGIPVTNKKDKKLHGFGIGNVIQKVEKYHGAFNFRSEDKYFFAEIHMKNE